jgi:hypothetical protein
MLGQQRMSFACCSWNTPATTAISAACEPQAAAGHAEQAHEGADVEPRAA